MMTQNDKSSERRCGCEVVRKMWHIEYETKYCPTHSLAFEMREAITLIKKAYDFYKDRIEFRKNTPPHIQACLDVYELLRKVKEVKP
jgi:hypothetical protein